MLKTSRFYGRKQELELLHRLQNDVLKRGISRFAVVTGRRRIGKTRLIDEALPSSAEMPTVSFFVSSQLSATNLTVFTEEIRRALELPYLPALKSFGEALELIFREAERRPVTLFFDEFQNFQTVAPEVFDDLQRLWDKYQLKSRILIVACGSVASSMRAIFEDGSAPLYARGSAFIRLQPFLPQLLKEIFADSKSDFTGDDLLALYAFTGGVAQYVQTFLSDEAFNFDDMLRHALMFNAGLVSEAQLMIAAEFGRKAATLNEILMAIATGKTKRAELAAAFDVDISGHLAQLENFYGLIERVEPLGNNGSVRQRLHYELADELLDFWYSFCLPNVQMLQANKTSALRESIRAGYPTWSGRVLERLYRRHCRNLGIFTDVSPWWDRRGENEIDLVAVNSVSGRIVFAEVKRNPGKINLQKLEQKSEAFFECNPKMAKFDRQYCGFSLTELGAEGKLPFLDEEASD